MQIPQDSILKPNQLSSNLNDLFLLIEHNNVCDFAHDNNICVFDANLGKIFENLT